MNKKFWTETWYFLLFLMGGMLVIVFFSSLLRMVTTCLGDVSGFVHSASYYHVIQWMQTIFVLVLPALMWCRWRMKLPFAEGLKTGKARSWKIYAMVIILALAILPMMDSFEEACSKLPLPEALRQIAEEELATQEEILQKMLSVNGIGGWFELVLQMSVATAIAEELAFRGALLTIFRRYTKLNKHVIAILIGFIFSAIHMEIYGLIPRWLLGTLFVYLVYHSGSIWPSVLAHALNNLYALLEYKGVIG